MLLADLVDCRQLITGIECAKLRREGNICRSREDHVLMIVICIEQIDQLFQLIGVHLALMPRNRQHLMTAKFNSPRLMAGNVPRGRGDHALIRSKQHVEHNLVGLRAACKEKHVGIRRLASLTNQLLGVSAMGVFTVTGHCFHVGIDQSCQNLRASAKGIIVLKRNQKMLLLLGLR